MIYTIHGVGYLWTETVLLTALGFVLGIFIHVAITERLRKTYDNWRYQLPDKLFIQENELSRNFANFKKWRR